MTAYFAKAWANVVLTARGDATVRAYLIMAWAIVVLVATIAAYLRGSAVPMPPGPPASMERAATRDLRPNHLLGPGDLRLVADPLQDFAGRYITAGATIPKGGTVALDRTSLVPDVWPEAQRVLLGLEGPPTLLTLGVNAGSRVDLCTVSNLRLAEAYVKAIRCTAGVCSLALDVPPREAAAVVAALGGKKPEIVYLCE